jgi:hypothetical protein
MSDKHELAFLAEQIGVMREMEAREVSRVELEIERFLAGEAKRNAQRKDRRIRHHYRQGRVQSRDQQ